MSSSNSATSRSLSELEANCSSLDTTVDHDNFTFGCHNSYRDDGTVYPNRPKNSKA